MTGARRIFWREDALGFMAVGGGESGCFFRLPERMSGICVLVVVVVVVYDDFDFW